MPMLTPRGAMRACKAWVNARWVWRTRQPTLPLVGSRSSSGAAAEGAAASRLRAIAAMPTRIDPRGALCDSYGSISNLFPGKAPALDDWALGQSNRAPRQWPEGGLSRVPYWIYTDPEVYQAEQERIFCGPSWCYVALEAEIPDPGDYISTFVGDKPVVI